jgi:HK97 family phage major capsid protein
MRVKKIVGLKGTASGWAGENSARTETATTELVAVHPSFGELYAYPAITRHLLEDIAFDLEQWLLESVATEFAVREGAAFISGNGVTKPLGFLSFPVGAAPNTEADAIRTPGRLQYIATGADGAFGAAPAMADKLVELVYSLRAGYRANATWVMNSTTAGAVRRLKDSEGRFLWTDGLVIGQPPSLLGYPVLICEDMPTFSTTGAFAVAFGDFRAGYLVADRAGLTMVRDEISQPGTIKFYVAKRVGGAMLDSDAIKLLKFSAT